MPLCAKADRTRRRLALAVIHDGASRAEAVRTGGVGLQIVPAGDDRKTVRWALSNPPLDR